MKKLTWHKIEPFHAHKPTERWGHSSCVIGSELVVFGGYADNYYMNDMWAFSTLTLEWKYHETSGDIPEPRSNATLNYDHLSHRLVLFGGGGQGKKRFNSVFALNWKNKKWTELEPQHYEHKPWQRTYHVSQIIDKYLVIFGGQNFADLNDLWLFDLQFHIWHEVKVPIDAPHPSPRRFHSAVLRNNKLIIIGGCHGKYRSLKDVYEMDFKQFLSKKDVGMLSWKQIIVESSDFIPRWGHSSSYNPLNDKIYIFGGRFSNDLQDIIILDVEKRTSKKVYTTQEQNPCPRRRHSANFIGSSLLIFGGFNGNYFNDLYSIGISLQSPIPKFFPDAVIPFSEFLRKQHQDTVSFMQSYVQNFSKMMEELKKKYDEDGINVILSSIVRGYELQPEKYREELQSLRLSHLMGRKIHISKQGKTQQIRCEYTMCHVLQEKMNSSKRLKITTLQQQKDGKQTAKTFTQNNYKLFPPYEVSSEIVMISEMDFYHYMQDHNKVRVEEIGKRFYRYLEGGKGQQGTFCIQFEGIGRFAVDPLVRFVNQYCYHAFKENPTLHFHNLTLHNLKVFEVGLMFLQTNILVVPKNFSYDQWKSLAEFAKYFCIENLLKIVEKFFIAKIDFTNITELSMISCEFKMKHLMQKCVQMIIQREEMRFFMQKNPIRKIRPNLFEEFEDRFFERPENFYFPEQFQREVTKQFEMNKLNIFLRNIVKIREMGGGIKSKMWVENNQKENEENKLMFI